MKQLLILMCLTGLSYGQVTTNSGVGITSGVSLGKGSGNPKTLQVITIAPTSASVAIGGTASFTATGTYSDSSTADITLQVTWFSSNTSVAVQGAAADPQPFSGVSVGTSNISASLQGVTSNVAVMSVNPQPLVITTTSCPLGTNGVAYTCQLTATGGAPAYTWSISVGALPSWATLNTSTGAITGTPNANVSTPFTAKVTDTLSATATQQLHIDVTGGGGTVTDENFYDNVDGTCKNMGLTDGPANLPVKCFNTALVNTPSPGGFYCVAPTGQTLPATCTGSVANFTSITAAFNAAAAGTIPCGSTIKIVATSTGLSSGTQNIYDETNVTVPTVSCNSANWMTVETDMISSLPPEQTRISPAWTNIASLPGRPTYNQPAVVGNYMPMIRNKAFGGPIFKIGSTTSASAPIASFWRFIGLEIAQPGPGTPQCVGHPCQNQWNNFLITTGCDPASKSVICPDHIIFDRIIADPDAHTGLDTTTVCFGVNGSATNWAIIDSYFYGIKIPLNFPGNCEAKALGMGNNTAGGTQGPYKISNNFLEGSAEVMFWGGGFSVNDATNVEVRRNHLWKPFNLWMPGQPGYLGGLMLVKNIYESKAIVQALVEGNIAEYNWYGHAFPNGQPLTDQFGSPILLHAAEGNLGQSHQSVGQDVTFRYNWVRHAARGVDFDISDCTNSRIAGCGTNWPPGDVNPLIQRESVHDNLWDDISTRWFTNHYGSIGSFDGSNIIFGNGIANVGPFSGTLNHLTANHNTFITSSYSQDVVVNSITTNGTGTATVTFSNALPATATTRVGIKIQVFGACAGFNEYSTIATTGTGTFTYHSGAAANSTCNSGFISLLNPIVGGATHLNEASSDDVLTGVSENGSLAEVTVKYLRNKPALFNIMCTSVNPPTGCKTGQVTTFTVWGLTGANACYNSNQPNCGTGGTTTTPTTWTLVGRASCLVDGLSAVAVGSGGTGYVVNDIVTLPQTPPFTSGTVKVTSVGTGGVVTGIALNTRGSGFSVTNGVATLGGSGTGLTVNVTAITGQGFGFVTGGGDASPCKQDFTEVFWYNHIQSGLPTAVANNGSYFSYWASLGRPNYGPDPNPSWQNIVVTNNIIAGKATQEQGNCQNPGQQITSDGSINRCGVVATTGPGAVNYTCNVMVSHPAIELNSTADTLPAGNVDSPDTTYIGIKFSNFNYDNLGASVNNLSDLALDPTSPFITGVSAAGCTSDGLPTGANMSLIQQYTAGVL